MITIEKNIIKADTRGNTLLLKTHGIFCEILYCGKRIDNIKGIEYLSVINRIDGFASVDNYNAYNGIFSFFGDGNDMQPFVLVHNSDGSDLSKFEFLRAEIVCGVTDCPVPRAKGSGATVALRFYDAFNAVEVTLFIDTYADSDIITFSSSVKNRGDSPVSVERLFSAQIDTDGTDFDIVTLDGAWIRERQINRTHLTAGTFVSETVSGMSSNKHNPFVAVKDNVTGRYTAFNTIWSGNHKFKAEVSPLGYTRFLCGMNDFAFSYKLGKGETLYSPQTAVLFASDLQKVTKEFHKFVTNHIVPERFRAAERPVLFNSWEAMYFDFNGNKLLSVAKEAKNLGVELFVLDDGWFVGRNNSCAGLGDWEDDVNKTGGLDKLSADIKKLGLKFGIWVEPEMVNKISRIYVEHPEYAMARTRDKSPIERRAQLVMDLVNPEVSDYVFNALCKVFDKCKPDYVKWDCNRFLTDIYGANCKNAGTYCYKYVLALYSLFDKITKKYPDILFEGCSAGGNRFDLGILSFMPQIWASDNTDARARVDIQEGTLICYPQSVMTAHVSACPNHQTGNFTPLRERFIVACGGVLGYELDLRKISEEEKAEIAEQIKFYKRHRKLFQFGRYARVKESGDLKISSVTAQDGCEAAVSVIRINNKVNGVREKINLGTFDKRYDYSVEIYGEDVRFEISGELLSEGRLDLSQYLRTNNTNAISAMMLYISAIRP